MSLPSSTRPALVGPHYYPEPPLPPPLGYHVESGPPPAWLFDRGLLDPTIEHFDLGLSDDPRSLKGRVLIPLHDAEGTLTGFAGRWPADPVPRDRSKYRFVGHGESEPYNLHRVIAVGSGIPVVVTGSPFDVFHLWQHGCESVVALFTHEIREDALLRLVHRLPDRPFTLLFDETLRGRGRRLQLLERLGRYAFVRAPRFHEDDRTVDTLTAAEIREEL